MNVFEISLTVTMGVLALCLGLALVRFVKGPSLPDRVTAFDLFAGIVIGITAVYAILTDNPAIMDVAIFLSLFGFLGSMSFAYYLMKRLKEKAEDSGKPNPEKLE